MGDNDNVDGNGVTGYDDDNGYGTTGDNVDDADGNGAMGYDDDDGDGATDDDGDGATGDNVNDVDGDLGLGARPPPPSSLPTPRLVGG